MLRLIAAVSVSAWICCAGQAQAVVHINCGLLDTASDQSDADRAETALTGLDQKVVDSALAWSQAVARYERPALLPRYNDPRNRRPGAAATVSPRFELRPDRPPLPTPSQRLIGAANTVAQMLVETDMSREDVLAAERASITSGIPADYREAVAIYALAKAYQHSAHRDFEHSIQEFDAWSCLRHFNVEIEQNFGDRFPLKQWLEDRQSDVFNHKAPFESTLPNPLFVSASNENFALGEFLADLHKDQERAHTVLEGLDPIVAYLNQLEIHARLLDAPYQTGNALQNAFAAPGGPGSLRPACIQAEFAIPTNVAAMDRDIARIEALPNPGNRRLNDAEAQLIVDTFYDYMPLMMATKPLWDACGPLVRSTAIEPTIPFRRLIEDLARPHLGRARSLLGVAGRKAEDGETLP